MIELSMKRRARYWACATAVTLAHSLVQVYSCMRCRRCNPGFERRWPQHNEGTHYGTQRCLFTLSNLISTSHFCRPHTRIPQAKVEPERDAKAHVIRVYVRTAKWNVLVLKGPSMTLKRQFERTEEPASDKQFLTSFVYSTLGTPCSLLASTDVLNYWFSIWSSSS